MANVQGLTANELAAQILRLVPGPKDDRPSGPVVLSYMDDAIRDMARKAGAFRRTEVLKTYGSKRTYRLATPPVKVFRVRYGSTRLAQTTEDELDGRVDVGGGAWRGIAGTPQTWFGEDAVSLYPMPKTDGDDLTFGSSALTPEEGYSIAGHGYALGFSGSTPVFFRFGDGVWSNEDTAVGVLFVDYAYMPTPLQPTTLVPYSFHSAIKHYVLSQIYQGADADRERQKYMEEVGVLVAGIIDPVWEHRHYEAVQQAIAQGQPPPRLMAEDYERIVHRALKDGNPAEREFVLNGQFLQQAVQQAIYEGKAVSPAILRAFERFVHDLGPYNAEVATALPWAYLQSYVQTALADSRPVDPVILKAYLDRQAVVEAGHTENTLRGELPLGGFGRRF